MKNPEYRKRKNRQAREYYKRNRKKKLDYNKKWKKDNKEKWEQYRHNYRTKNPTAIYTRIKAQCRNRKNGCMKMTKREFVNWYKEFYR